MWETREIMASFTTNWIGDSKELKFLYTERDRDIKLMWLLVISFLFSRTCSVNHKWNPFVSRLLQRSIKNGSLLQAIIHRTVQSGPIFLASCHFGTSDQHVLYICLELRGYSLDGHQFYVNGKIQVDEQ